MQQTDRRCWSGISFAMVLLLPALWGTAQPIVPTPAAERLAGINSGMKMRDESMLKNIPFTNIGPCIMSGRCVDLDVNPNDPTEFYVAYATGGLWHTRNNGQSFVPVFDQEGVITIGAIAVDWDHPAQLWVGTGEVNSSRSSYAGIGVYKTSNAGQTWQYKGLPESQHIGKILLEPGDTNTVYVAVLGHLYSSNPERGVYKTRDGGASWERMLFLNDHTGCVDLQRNPLQHRELFACMWDRSRSAWNFTGSGTGSGIYKSNDEGVHWTLLTPDGSGFPAGAGTGRIGVSVAASDTSVLFAILDNENEKTRQEKPDTTTYSAAELKSISQAQFALLNDDRLNRFMLTHGIPGKYDAKKVKALVAKGKLKPTCLTDFLNDANNSLFHSPVIGEEVYCSRDGGKHWAKTDTGSLFELCYTYGYYFGKIFVSPFSENKIVVCGVPMLLSLDGGISFYAIDGDNTHGDHHALWFDPKKDGHFIIGNDGGVALTYDDGKNWFKANTPPVGQFYSVAVDDAKPYQVYGGLQDNGVWTGPSDYTAGNGWLQEGQYAYKRLYDGDGMQVQVDTRDNNTVYAGFQFGNYARINKSTGDNTAIQPAYDLGETPLRFNWQSPILLSHFNQDILYFGTNKLFRSMDKGNHFEAISPDLTNADKQGNVPFNTLVTLCESPLHFGEIWCGTDDGNIWFTRDGGKEWKECFPGKNIKDLPAGLYVSRITVSSFAEGRVYVTLNGYRNDDFHPYLLVTSDAGETWSRIGNDLPMEPLNVVKEDPRIDHLIYVGSDNGLYASLDGGQHFMAFGSNLPRVPVHDIAIQPTANEIVLGTHGRSLYKGSLDLIQQLSDSLMEEYVQVLKIPDVPVEQDWGSRPDAFGSFQVPSLSIPFWVKNPGVVTVTIENDHHTPLYSFQDTASAGINLAAYHGWLKESAADTVKNSLTEKARHKFRKAPDGHWYLPPGVYTVSIQTAAGNVSKQPFEITKKDSLNPPAQKELPGF